MGKGNLEYMRNTQEPKLQEKEEKNASTNASLHWIRLWSVKAQILLALVEFFKSGGGVSLVRGLLRLSESWKLMNSIEECDFVFAIGA